MTLEHKSSQEQAEVAGGHGPFDPTNKERIAELDAKFEGGAEKITIPEGVLHIDGMGTAFRDADGTYVSMSIVADDIWVSRVRPILFSETTNQRTGEVEKIDNPTFEKGAIYAIKGEEKEKILARFGGLEATKKLIQQVESTETATLDTAERGVRAKEAESREAHEKLSRLDGTLMQLYRDSDLASDGFDPFWGRFNGDSGRKIAETRKALESLSASEQEAIAAKFFEDTIGVAISNNKKAYMVYGALKGTAFSSKFKQLEDARLQAGGYGKFDL